MKISTLLIIAGIGPGNPDLVTLNALNYARTSQVILVPRSHKDVQGMAENIISHHLPNTPLTPIIFPMTSDVQRRGKIILSQLEALAPKLEVAERIFFPVIGDSMLYSTGAYLLDAMRMVIPDVEAEFIPGISAHSLAAACAKRFLAMSDDILSIIPGTAQPAKIKATLEHSDAIAIYKPTAIKNIHELVDPSQFTKVIRVDFAGIPEKERILEGAEALQGVKEYMSVILLWR